jgi:hypothetical protein
MTGSWHIRQRLAPLPLIPAPVALMQELVKEDASTDRVAEILADYPPDELRVMAAKLAEMAEMVNDYADKRKMRR